MAGASPTSVLTFALEATPIPQGSKVPFKLGDRILMVDSADRKTKTRRSGSLKRYKEQLSATAAHAMTGEPWTGPIELECVFVVPRSKSHYTSKGALTKSAPSVPGGDLDKLIRAVGDALSKVVYRDDVQIVSFGASTKKFAEYHGDSGCVLVTVRAL
jgi:Holliday junction resolvase RusA-like endonuclease